MPTATQPDSNPHRFSPPPPARTGARLAIVLIDAFIGGFWALGGLLLVLATRGDESPGAAFDFHSGLVYLPVGMAILAGGLLNIRRQPAYLQIGVWTNSLGIVTAVFLFARNLIDRAVADQTVAGLTQPLVSPQSVMVLIVVVTLFGLALRKCLQLLKEMERGPARGADYQTKPM